MVVPRKHTTKSAQRQRRAHIKLEKVALSTCPNCGSPKVPHRVCKTCGYYKGAAVKPPKIKTKK